MKIEEIENLANKFLSEIEEMENVESAKLRKEELLRNYKGDDEIVPWSYFEERIKNSPKLEVMPLGQPQLDGFMGGGFSTGQLIALTGITKNGKTAWAVDMTHRMSKFAPLWFPFEETAEELVRKQMEYGRAMPRAFAPKNITNYSIEWIEEKIIESVIKYNTKIVFVDHLHFLANFGEAKERFDLQLTKLVSDLKKLAKKTDTAIVLVVHLRKVMLDKAPDINDIKETSSVAQWSDKVLIVWREAKKDKHTGHIEYSGMTYVQLGADRQTGNVETVGYHFNKGTYDEVSCEALLEYLTENKKQNEKDF
jgi:replicative DNA helicase